MFQKLNDRMKEMLAYRLPAFFLKGELAMDKEFLQEVANFNRWAKTTDQSCRVLEG
ncbi:hypothetical protein V7201_16830 [Bacillus sp. JJ1122]|uniref:hypothetical protein n=1 Tax=Bacillus sp. JJ1122 TaxID=3122951 RepID=UPI002FFDC801